MKTFRTKTAAAALTAAALLLVVPAVAQPPAGAAGAGHGPGHAMGHGSGHGPGFAHGSGHGEGGHFGARFLARMAEILELTDAQVAQAKALHEQTRAEAQPLRESSRTLHQELRALLDQEAPDATAVGQTVIALHANRAAMREIHADAKAGFEALLTPEQLDKLETLEELRGAGRGHHGRRGGARGAGFSG